MTTIATAAGDEFPVVLKWFMRFSALGTSALALKQLLDPAGALKMLAQAPLHAKLDNEGDDLVKLARGLTRWLGIFFLVFSLANAYVTTLPLSQAKPLLRVLGVCWVLDSLVVKVLGFHLQAPHVFNKADAVGGGSFDLFTGLVLLKTSL